MPIQNVDGLTTLLLPLAMIVFIILVMVIPQRKRRKQMEAMLASLQPGKMIKTIGGLYGKIVAVKDDLITIEVPPDKVRLVFSKGAVATVEDSDLPENEIDSKK
ncbi:MAG: preprotein translocase subunit YajC [Christensenellales bacterium]